tara:strand:+ start:102 stop:500 length:399 start_codon:yes stop_codon:yes gene_type:complete
MSPEEICIENYVRDQKLIFEKIKYDYDGTYEYDGMVFPDGKLYDYILIIEKDNELFYDIFHREDWGLKDDDDTYYPLDCKAPFKNNLSEIFIKNGYDPKKLNYDNFELGNRYNSLDKDYVSLRGNFILYFKV